MYLKIYRGPLVHCEGSMSEEKIKAGIIAILKEIDKLTDTDEYSENGYMMY